VRSRSKIRGDSQLGRSLRLGTRRLSTWMLVLGIVSAQCLSATESNGSGGLTGSVVDDSGKPVAGARVLISHAPSVPPPFPAPPVLTGPLATTASPDATGAFRVDNLSPGQYIACAETTAPGFLDPCHWSVSAPSFTISAGQTTSGINIVMTKGAVLWVQVNDPQQYLKPVTGPVDLNLEIHVVTSKGVHYSAPIQSSTATERSHAITIPYGSPVTLRILSSHLAVNDRSGMPVAAIGTTVSVPTGTNPPTAVFTITGAK